MPSIKIRDLFARISFARSPDPAASIMDTKMKTVLLAIKIQLSLLSFCHGQSNRGDILNGTSQKEIENNHTSPSGTFKGLPFINGINQIDQVVRTVFQDSRGNIWFGTESGVFKLTDNSLIQIEGIRSESGKSVTIKDMAEDKDGIIWIGHSDGISCIKEENVINYYESDGLISNDVWCITTDSAGKIWIGTIDGICVFDNIKFARFTLPDGIKDTTVGVSSAKMVHDILQDSKGCIWITSNAGLFQYSNNTLTNVSHKLGIKTNFVNTLFEDSKGGLWISSKAGLYHLNDHGARNIIDENINIGKGIGSIAEDKDGRIWFVCNQHFLYTYDGQDLTEFQKSEENKGPVVFQIYKDQEDRLWFVGFGGAYRLEHGKFLHITKNGPW